MKSYQQFRRRYALTGQGGRDLVRSILACAAMDLVLMLPVGLLFFMVQELMEGGLPRSWPLAAAAVLCLVAIGAMEWVKYDRQFTSVYVESGRRRIALAEKLRRLPLAFFGKKDLADLTSTLMADCATIETGTSHWVPELYGSMLSTTVVGAGLFLFDWRMALAAVWVVPVAIGIVAFSGRVQNRFSRRQNAANMALADGIQEGLECFQDLRACNAERRYLASLGTRIAQAERRAIQAEAGVAAFVVSGQLVLRLGIATVALVGASLLASGSLGVLPFFMFLLVASRLYDPMSASLVNLGAVLSMRVPCRRIGEVQDHPQQEGSAGLTNRGHDIEFRDVNFAYDASVPVLRRVSFTARQGEVTAVIGPSGSGKTTVSRLAARFWDPSSGTITVGGMDIAQVDPEALMGLYSIVFQDVTLFNNTVLENIRIGRPTASDDEVRAAAALAHVDEVVRRLADGWQTLIGENGSLLSGGERQRISIARAFLKDAPILLLDEATASLDVENETLVQESLARLVQGRTVLLIAHRMRTVAAADRVVVLQDGAVAECGAPAALAAAGGLYAHLSALQGGADGWRL